MLRLHYVNGFSSRAISESTKDGKTTINDFLKRFRESTVLTWPLSDDVTNEMIERLLYKKSGNITNDEFYRGFNEEEVHRKLAKKGEIVRNRRMHRNQLLTIIPVPWSSPVLTEHPVRRSLSRPSGAN